MSEKPTRKRNRPTVVCSNCRAKKTKCDRKFPCSCCLKAGIADTCNLGTKKDSANGEQASSGTVVSNPAYKNPILNPVVDGTFGCEAIPIPRGVGAFNSGAIGNNINNNISNIGSNIGSSSLIGNDPVVQNQLEFLKNKLRALEASITVASLHKPSFSSYTSPSSTSPSSVLSGNGNGNGNVGGSLTGSLVSSQGSHIRLPGPSYFSMDSNKGLGNGFPSGVVENNNFIGANPFFSNDDTINYYQDFRIPGSNVQPLNNNKPLPLLSMARINPSVQLFFRYKQQIRKDFEKKRQDLLSLTDPNKEHCKGACQKADGNGTGNSGKEMKGVFCSAMSNAQKADFSKETIRSIGKSIGLTFNWAPLADNLILNEKIVAILPPGKVICRLIDRFFAVLYPFLPIIDEHSFRNDFKRIFGDKPVDIIAHLTTESKYDYLFIAKTLILLRLSYLSLVKNSLHLNESAMKMMDNPDLSVEAKDLKWLLNNPIPIDAIDAAQLCLQKVDITRKPLLITFQCMLLLRTYRILAPDEGDRAMNGDSQTFTGILIHQAYALGLNRDPDHFLEEAQHQWSSLVVDHRANNLRRKLWHFMVAEDILSCITLGNSISLRECEYDTKLPHYYEGNENVFDINLEMDVVSSFALFEKLRKPITDILDVMLNTRKNTPLNEYTSKISKLESLMISELGSIEEYLNPSFNSSGFLKIMRLRLFFNVYLLLIPTYYSLYLYYERKDKSQNLIPGSAMSKIAFHYYSKFIQYSVSNITPLVPELLDESYNYLDKAAALILSPIIESVNHNTFLCNIVTCASIQSTQITLQQNSMHNSLMATDINYKERFDTLTLLVERLGDLREFNAWISNILSYRYFVAWKLRKIHLYSCNFLKTDEFFTGDLELTRNASTSMSTMELNELIKICDTGIEKYKKSSKYAAANAANGTSTSNMPTPGSVSSVGVGQGTKIDIPPFDEVKSDAFWMCFFTARMDDDFFLSIGGIAQHVKAIVTQSNTATSTEDPSANTYNNIYNLNGGFRTKVNTPTTGFPNTPQFDIPDATIEYDFGLFNGQSFEEFLSNS